MYQAFPGMELLLMLAELDFDAGKADYVYFSKSQGNCIRRIHDFVVEHIAEHYTIAELAERLLQEGELSVAEIAAKIGYTNLNKFTSAFCSGYRMPPTACLIAKKLIK